MSILTDKGDLKSPYRSFIAKSRYSRWLEEENRRETWQETTDRYVEFMRGTDAGRLVEDDEWTSIRTAILEQDVMPSMRALMTAGPALARENLAQFNCSFIAVDDLRSFDEALYILMNGVGLGFSVESQYVSQLPTVNEHFESTHTTIVVEDSKAGWARAFRELLAMLYAGQVPTIDVSKLRPAGARLKTFGGRASGPQPLVDLFDFSIGTIRKAAGRKLTPLECHDLMCMVGDVVVVGGVRRSALISLSDLHDYEMSKAKTGTWWKDTGYRRLANNSAVYYKKPSVGEFLGEWGNLYESHSGERGIVNMEAFRTSIYTPRRDMSLIQGLNPCGEILLRSKELCNLTEVIVKDGDTKKRLVEKVRIATILGTVQSSLTNFKYLRKIWRDNCNEERLLGVSLTGQFGHAMLSGSEGLDKLGLWLDELRETAIRVNATFAGIFGIAVSSAITTVKPSGTVSQLTNSSSGMHPWYAQWYVRSVRGDNKDPMTQFMIDFGVPHEADVMAPNTTTIFYFPVAAPTTGIVRSELTAIQHLEVWKVYKTHWTEHNPSVTINVKEDEWIEVANWVYKNWEFVGGISFLPYDTGDYQQAPYKEITEIEYKELVEQMPVLDWTWLSDYEHEDTTTGMQTLACTANNCEVVSIGSVEEAVLV